MAAQDDVNNRPSGLPPLIFRTFCKKKPTTAGNKQNYYGPEMTFGAKSTDILQEILLRLRAPWWHFSKPEVNCSVVNGIYYGRRKSSLDPPPGIMQILKYYVLLFIL